MSTAVSEAGYLEPNDATSSMIDIFLSAVDLPKMDLTSNSDPFAVAFLSSQRNSKGSEVFRTEVAKDTQRPNWTTNLRIPYKFEEMQYLTIQVYDEDKAGSTDLHHHDFIGEAQITVGELMGVDGGVPGDAQRFMTKRGERRGLLHFHAEEVAVSDLSLIVQFRAKKLANKDGLFGRSDPYLVCNRMRETGGWTAVWKSEVIMNDLSPVWRTAKLPLTQICNGDPQRPLRFEVYDYDRTGDHDYMGHFETSVEGILGDGANHVNHTGSGHLETHPSFPVIEEAKKKKKKKYLNSGEVFVEHCSLIRVPSFVSYLKAGLELNMAVAIDFTGSNGDPSRPSSLHYFDPSGTQMNFYQCAIQAIGEVMECYDSDKQFPVYGFGARLGRNPTSHCFPLSQGGDIAEVEGIAGIMDAYRAILGMASFALSGPTIFTNIINAAMERARHLEHEMVSGGKLAYEVLVILTDGVINDEMNTRDAIVQASSFPISIIIVGVGYADFSAMEALDGDETKLTDRHGREAARDIVQFVSMRDFEKPNGVDWSGIRTSLLAELPEQVTQFMIAKGRMPELPSDLPVAPVSSSAAAKPPSIGPAPPSYS